MIEVKNEGVLLSKTDYRRITGISFMAYQLRLFSLLYQCVNDVNLR